MGLSVFYDLDGNPISLFDWCRIFEDDESRQLGTTRIKGVVVSTVWLGLDLDVYADPPLIFETVVFHRRPPYEPIATFRYATRDQASAGHVWVSEQVRDHGWAVLVVDV